MGEGDGAGESCLKEALAFPARYWSKLGRWLEWRAKNEECERDFDYSCLP